MRPVIMCGGAGTRLWPVSRPLFPKPFSEFFAESLIEKTWKRLEPLGQPALLTVSELKAISQRTLRNLGASTEQSIFEPFGRNTAPAIGLICQWFRFQNLEEEVVGVFPADHLITKEDLFRSALGTAEELAQNGEIVTLGITPTYPATGFGYIECADEKLRSGAEGLLALRAKGFREKPDVKTAEKFIQKGNFFWNGGVFVFKVSTMVRAFEQYQPQMWKNLCSLKSDLSNLEEVYKNLDSISIDYAIMEKVEKLACVPVDPGWSDIGSWDEVAKLEADLPPQKKFSVDSEGAFVFSTDKNKVFAFVDMPETVVVDTRDACLLIKRGSTQRVKEVLEKVAAAKEPAATQHTFEDRPWGRFDVLKDTNFYKSKIIRVDGGQQLSYQSHAQRAEHWIVVKGRGEVVLNDETVSLKTGEYIFIPQGARHRMRNPFKEPMEFVEVQVGTYFGEDDIVRYSDDYGRGK